MPTPKELELSRQLVDLQKEKDQRELKLLAQIGDLEAQIQKCALLMLLFDGDLLFTTHTSAAR